MNTSMMKIAAAYEPRLLELRILHFPQEANCNGCDEDADDQNDDSCCRTIANVEEGKVLSIREIRQQFSVVSGPTAGRDVHKIKKLQIIDNAKNDPDQDNVLDRW